MKSKTPAPFPRVERLRDKRMILHLLKKGKREKMGSITIYALPHPTRPHHQVAFIVGKRGVPRAVDRNRIRRKMRNFYRLHKDRWPRPMSLLISYNPTPRARKIAGGA